MNIIYTIAKYTVVEAIRDKFIWFVLALMLAGIPLGYFLKTLTLYGSETVVSATMIGVIYLSIAFISVLYVNIATRRELDSKIMLIVLSRPVSNTSYLLGKHLGFWFVTTIYVVIGTILLFAMGVGETKSILLFALGTWLLQCLVVMWSLFFALLLNSLAASVLVSIVAWVFFNSTQTLWTLTFYAQSAIVKYTGAAFYYIMPNYTRFDFKHSLLYNEPVEMFNVAVLPVYTLVYATVVLLIMWIDFSRKEY